MINAPSPEPAPTPWLRHIASVLAVAAVLLGVLMLYSQPGFMVMLSDMVWACFG